MVSWMSSNCHHIHSYSIFSHFQPFSTLIGEITLVVCRHLSRLESFGVFEAELGNFEMDILTDQRVSRTLNSEISKM